MNKRTALSFTYNTPSYYINILYRIFSLHIQIKPYFPFVSCTLLTIQKMFVRYTLTHSLSLSPSFTSNHVFNTFEVFLQCSLSPSSLTCLFDCLLLYSFACLKRNRKLADSKFKDFQYCFDLEIFCKILI